jgi:tetratricopeptide (TPR) repeat protein
MPTFFIVFFGIAWISAAAWLWFYFRFTRYLEKKHPALLNDIGELSSPGQRMVSPNEIRGLFGLIGFLLKKRYLRLTDRELIALAEGGRKIFILNIIAMLALFASLPTVFLQESGLPGTGSTTGNSTPAPISANAERLYALGRYEEARVFLDQALAAQPENANLLYWRGLTHEKLGNAQDALEDFTEVVTLVPDHFNSYQHLDYLLFQQGRTDEIISWWDRYLAEAPDDAAALLERGGTWFRMGNTENAAADARRACELGNAEACQRYTQVTGETL